MYGVVYAVILHPFPYKEVATLKAIKVWIPALEIAERNSIFEGFIASTLSDVLWTGQGEPQRLRGNRVTTNTF